jgi:hypothetical protein
MEVTNSPNFGMTSPYSSPFQRSNDNKTIHSEKRCYFPGGSMVLFVNNNLETSNNDRAINGKLVISIDNVCFVRGIWVCLHGTTELMGQSKSSFGKAIQTKNLLEKEDDFHVDGIYRIFMGFGKHDNDLDQLVQLEAGNYSWPFSFSLKAEYPLSYCDQFARTDYKVISQFDTPHTRSYLTQIVHYVNVSHFPSEDISTAFQSKTILGKHEVLAIKSQSKISSIFASFFCSS